MNGNQILNTLWIKYTFHAGYLLNSERIALKLTQVPLTAIVLVVFAMTTFNMSGVLPISSMDFPRAVFPDHVIHHFKEQFLLFLTI